MKYIPVIGLEVHVELKTSSKMFCQNSTEYFGQTPNIHTCPICLGFPGSLPYINKQAIEDCIKIGLALNCEVQDYSVFERKNYFYPDLAKGYQISQYRWPLCRNGWIEVKDREGKTRKIRINRVHQEEDTGKLFHQQDMTLIDFNRSGVPLVEIVTEPDFQDTREIKDYAQKLQRIMRYLDVSNADMEKGDMRLEANVSLRELKNEKFELPPYRVELKNINSFRFMVEAVEYEIKRQEEALNDGEKLSQETRGWDEVGKKTYLQRTKEEAQDYRYFPDPDLPPLEIDRDRVKVISEQMPELPDQKVDRFGREYELTGYQAEILTDSRKQADFFEEAVKSGREHGIDATKVANTLINKTVDYAKTLPAELIKILHEAGEKPTTSDEVLERVIVQSIKQHKQAVEDYRKGKATAVEFLVGQVMRETSGKADPNKVRKLLVIALVEMQ